MPHGALGVGVTGLRVFVAGLVFGLLRVPAQAVLGPETMETLDEIVKLGAAAGVVYSAWRYVLRPLGALLVAKVQKSRALTAVVLELPSRLDRDDARHRETIERLDSIDKRLARGAAWMKQDRESIERIEQSIGGVADDDAAPDSSRP